MDTRTRDLEQLAMQCLLKLIYNSDVARVMEAMPYIMTVLNAQPRDQRLEPDIQALLEQYFTKLEESSTLTARIKALRRVVHVTCFLVCLLLGVFFVVCHRMFT